MADQVSTLALKVDSSQATAGLQQMGRATEQLSSKAMDLKQKLMFLGSAYFYGRFGKQLLDEAATGQEALGKFQQVLGRFTKEANGMVEELRANFNFDATSAQAAISTMADQFHKSGASMRQSLDMTFELQKLSGDLEAFTNAEGGVAAVSQALSTGIMGQYMPLKKLGIVLNEEIVKEQMAKEKLEGLTFATKRAAQMNARYSLIVQQTAAAHGQVARESDNYNNKLRKFRATWSDFKNELGDAIIPAATQFMTASTKLMSGFEKLPQGAKTAIVGITGLALAARLGGAAIELVTKSVAGLVGGIVGKAAAAQKDTAATAANTTAETSNAAASNATATSKNLEASARMRNAAAIGAENAALNSQSTANITSTATGGAHHAVGKGAKAAKGAKLGNMASNAMTFMPMGGKAAGYAGRTLGGAGAKAALGGVGAKAAGAALGGTAGAGIIAQAASGVKKFLGVFKPMNGIIMKGAGFLGKLVGKFALMLPFVGKLVGFLGKSAIIGTLVRGLAKAASFLVPVTGWISMAITALEIFKNAPQWVEMGIDKLSEFGEKIPDILKAVGVKALEATKKLGVWLKDTLIGGILGLGQLIKRALTSRFNILGPIFRAILGDETQAQREYKLNKEREENNKKRQQILDMEEKQHAAEKALLNARARSKQTQLRGKLAEISHYDDDQTKLALAQTTKEDAQNAVDENNAEQEQKNRELLDVGKQQDELTASIKANEEARLAELASNEKKMEASHKKRMALIAAEYDRYLESIGDNPLAIGAKAQIKAEKTAKLFFAEDKYKLDRKKSVESINAKYNKQDSDLRAKYNELETSRQDLVETVNELANQSEGLTEELTNANIAFKDLTKAASAAKKQADEDAEATQERLSENEKAANKRTLEIALEDAKTSVDRKKAIEKLVAFTNQEIADAEAAETSANDADTKIQQIYARRDDENFGKILGDVSKIATGSADSVIGDVKVDDLTAEEVAALSDEERESRTQRLGELRDSMIRTALEDLKSKLEKQNYDLSDVDLGAAESTEEAATKLREAINAQREADAENLTDLIQKRDKFRGKADSLLSLKDELRSYEQQEKDEDKAQQNALRESEEEERDRKEGRMKLGRQRAETLNNEMYQRQMTAIEDSGMNAIDMSAAKYDLMAGKGASDWQESQAYMTNIGKELYGDTSVAGHVSLLKRKLERNDYSGEGGEEMRKSDEALLEKLQNQQLGVSGRIREIQKKQEAGTATEEDLNELQSLQSRRDQLQSDYDSEYDKALSNRWNTEKELYGLQKTMADEQDKQLRDYVTEQGDALQKQLEDQQAAAEEESQKRLAERSEVEKEQRQAVSGAKAIASGTSEAFQLQSRIFDRGQENLPPEKKIEKNTDELKKYVEEMKEQLYQYLSGNTAITLSMGY